MNLQQISLYLADVEVPLVNQTIDLSSVTQERVLRLQIAAGAIERLSRGMAQKCSFATGSATWSPVLRHSWTPDEFCNVGDDSR